MKVDRHGDQLNTQLTDMIMQTSAMFKGNLKKSYLCSIHTLFVSIYLSHSYGYYVHIIPELCSEFRVVDVGLIMALLQRDYSR